MTATAEAPSSPVISPLQIERLRGCRFSWKEAQERAEEKKESWLTAKGTRDERRETLATACDDEKVPEKKIASLAHDLTRAERKFDQLDREKRQVEDLSKKLGTKFVEIAEGIADGKADDLYAATVDTGEAWKGLLIADLVGDLQAMELGKNSIRTVGDLIEREDGVLTLIKSGEIDKKRTHFIMQTVALNMAANGRNREVPTFMKKLRDDSRLSPGEVPKEVKTETIPAEQPPEVTTPGE